jgi:hypothetical protein
MSFGANVAGAARIVARKAESNTKVFMTR